ncbi:MAG: hypothetical protein D3914_01810 [Candidatus Electrothrix sp. LOE2]|nr:hypothetical protein [Candidatus Electrothrix sp. LOE2]
MLGLSIVSLGIFVKTENGLFSVEIPFKSGLNIIRAENSSGKSTCVNAIAYGLGLEAILGPSGKRPFPKSLYKIIYDNKSDENKYFVSESYIELKVKNSRDDEVLLRRDVQGNADKITVESAIDRNDYFLCSSGNVGSYKSEKGFHYWLIDFLEWKLPKVATSDGKEVPLYLECIFPLFFIEQKRGWSEIQANTPLWGINNVKKAAIEFCLGIDSFKSDNEISKLLNEISVINDKWDKLNSKVLSIAEIKNVKVSDIGELDRKRPPYPISFKYLENSVYLSVDERLRSLEVLLSRLSNDIKNSTPDNEKLENQRTFVNSLRNESGKLSDKTDNLLLSIADIKNKLSKISNEYDKYNQLKRLKAVGASLGAALDTKKCPICENELYDTLGVKVPSRQPMTLEENIDFLKKQKDFFESILQRNFLILKERRREWSYIKAKLSAEEEKMSNLRADLDDVNGAIKSKLRELLQAEILQKNIIKLKEVQLNLNEELEKIYSDWLKADDSLKDARKKKKNIERDAVIKKLEAVIRGSLRDFHFKNAVIYSVSVSPRTLRPVQEGYDIVAETSASDYIRVIWAYTLALLELAGQNESEPAVKHGGFVVFDEPRQHEANMISFSGLIKKASKHKSFGGQIIVATSIKKSELEEACQGAKPNVVYFDDYILSLVTP